MLRSVSTKISSRLLTTVVSSRVPFLIEPAISLPVYKSQQPSVTIRVRKSMGDVLVSLIILLTKGDQTPESDVLIVPM